MIYLHEVVIPAFRIASDDQRRAVLGREQANELKEATAEYVGLVKEALEYKLEPQANPAVSEGDTKPEAVRSSATALVLAGRGSLDVAASQLIADAIRLERGIDTRCPPLGGLTGISSAAEAGSDGPPEVVALVSVGAVTRGQLDILVRRLRRSFPRSHIVIGCWDGSGETETPNDGTNEMRYAESVSTLVDFVGREAHERSPLAQTVRHLEAVATA